MKNGNNFEVDKEKDDKSVEKGNEKNKNKNKMYVVIYNIGKKKTLEILYEVVLHLMLVKYL